MSCQDSKSTEIAPESCADLAENIPKETQTLKRKHVHDDLHVNRVKQPKSNNCSESEETRFLDLHVYCFEHIFEYLSFTDLLNVADLGNESEKAAKLVFSRRYSRYVLKFSGYQMSRCYKIDDENAEITISTALLGGRILRHFSGNIRKIELFSFDEENLTKDWLNVLSSINEKCATNLRELKLSNIKCQLMEMVTKKTFDNVESLRISCSRLGKCMDLNKWFPKLDLLQLLHNDRCIQTVCNFPHLSYLALDVKGECSMSTDSFEALIKSAPTLKTLSLSGGMTSGHLRFISDALPNLKHLYLRNFNLDKDTDETEAMVVFRNVQTLSISTGLIGMLPAKIPFQFDGLTELNVITSDSLGAQWINFAMGQSDLVKLVLEATDDIEVTDDRLGDLAKALKKLIEADIFADISVEGVYQFLAKSQKLQKFHIETFSGKDYSSLRASMVPKWSIHQTTHGWTFKRACE